MSDVQHPAPRSTSIKSVADRLMNLSTPWTADDAKKKYNAICEELEAFAAAASEIQPTREDVLAMQKLFGAVVIELIQEHYWDARELVRGVQVEVEMPSGEPIVRALKKAAPQAVSGGKPREQAGADRSGPPAHPADAAAVCVVVPREAWKLALSALHEAEAILGGEYGDTYAILCETMCKLENVLAAAPEAATPNQSYERSDR